MAVKVGKGYKGTIEERFWRKVVKSDYCWTWTGATNDHGYGQIFFEGKLWYAHRMSFMLHTGNSPSAMVLHRCDNPPCIRPDHLFEGDNSTNMKDMWSKGRHVL